MRTRFTVAASLAVLSLGVAVAPGVRARLASAVSSAPHEAPQSGAVFSDPPTDNDFLRAGLFVQPLVPAGPTNPEENRQLGSLLVTYSRALIQRNRDAVQPLADFVAQHPDSVWAPGLQLELGAVYRQTGHFSKALTTWQSAWESSKDLQSANGRVVGDMAAAYLSQFEAYLGRKEQLAPLLQDLKTRPVRGPAAELISESARGLAEMESRPDVSFRCGPSALSRILKAHPTADVAASRRILDASGSTPTGLSLSAIQAVSVEAGMNFQMAFRSPGAPIIVPAVAHWKVGHYAALLGRDSRERILVGDATFGEDIDLTTSAFDEETSGYFLVPPGALPDGWRRVEMDEGSTVWGRGNTGGNHENGATGRKETQAFACGPGGGCTRWNVEASVTGLELRDDPIGYKPPVGPEIRFPMTYSHRDTLQPTPFPYTNFGNKWTFDWLSYVVDDANAFSNADTVVIVSGSQPIDTNPNARFTADLYRRGGGDEPYIFPSYQFAPQVEASSSQGEYSQAILTRQVDPVTKFATGYIRTLSDGSVERFTKVFGTLGVPLTRFFMSEVDDPQGNAVKIVYDANPNITRIVSIVDAMGQASTICYTDSPAPCVAPAASVSPTNNLQVTRIVDHFGRFATFQYDPTTGHLIGITDVLGITSGYHYSGSTSSSVNFDFVDTLTTPYGTTKFTYTDSTNLPTNDTSRSLQAVETSTLTTAPPRTSLVKFVQGGQSCPFVASNLTSLNKATFGGASSFDGNWIQCVDGNILSHAPPVPLSYGNLQYRNTFIWNPEQYAESFGTTNQSPYLGAKLMHWLHTDIEASNLTASRTLESTKEPLENRVWYLYPGQSANLWSSQFTSNTAGQSVAMGATNQPSDIIQAVGDGTYKRWQFAYDAYGHVTKSIDPVGRTLSMGYDPTTANNIDLLTVTNTTSGHNDLLLTLANYVQHRPQKVTAANGQTTQLAYNASGQLTSSTDPLNDKWTYNYTPAARGYLTSIVGPTVVPGTGAPQTPTYAFTYDDAGRLWTEEGPDGQLRTLFYDNADRLTKTLFPDGSTELQGYSYQGQPQLDLTSFTDRQGFTTAREYDGFRDLIEIDEPYGRTTTMTYYPDGTVHTVKDPLALGQTITYARDTQGRVKTVTRLDNSADWYGYDLVGRVTSKSPDVGITGKGSARYAYYLDDSVSVAMIDARAPTNFFYDPAYPRVVEWSRVQGGTWANPNCAACAPLDGEFYQYNPVGPAGAIGANKLHTVTTNISTLAASTVSFWGQAYTYDALDRVIESYMWNTEGPVTAEKHTVADEHFEYDAIGRLTYDLNNLDAFTYTYKDATARVTGRASGGGPQITASYFPPKQDGLLQQLSYTTAAPLYTSLAQYGYTYDARHNVLSFADSVNGTSTYTYDAYSQLSTGNLPDPAALTVTPDVAGNISSLQTIYPSAGRFSPARLSTTSFTYDSANKMTDDTTVSSGLVRTTNDRPVVCDSATGALDTVGAAPANGNSYAYDQSNRIYYSNNYGTSTNSFFLYDGLGRLSEVYESTAGVGPVSTIADHSYAWCGRKKCVEFDNLEPQVFLQSGSFTGYTATTSGTPDAIYVPQGTVTDSAATTGYDIKDLLGSERAFTSTATNPTQVLAEYDYDAFGNPYLVSGDATLSKDGFAGLYYDAPSGLQFARNRVYDSSLGRWLTRDPIGNEWAFDDPARFNATDLNLYAYAGNNPQTWSDPTGNCPQCVLAGVGAGIGAIAGGVGAYLMGGDVWAGVASGAVTGGLAGLTGGFSLVGQITAGVGAGLIGMEVGEGVRLIDGSPPIGPEGLAAAIVTPALGVGASNAFRGILQPTFDGVPAFAMRRVASSVTSFAINADVKACTK